MVQPTPTATDKAIKRDGRIVIALMSLFCKLDFPQSIDIRDDRPTLACANHRSLLDVFCAAAFCTSADVSCRFLVSAKYFENKITGRWLRRIGCIPLSAENKEEAFAEAKASLERGELIGIMPEGRLMTAKYRNPQVGPARPGASELARAANAYMRPIVFHNAETVWPKGRPPRLRLRRPTVTLILSDEHFEPTDDPQADVDQVMAALAAMLDDLDALDAT